MIIWLASYPRSGNTLTRQILKQCFGRDSYSVYSDGKTVPGPLAKLTGHTVHGQSENELVAAARKSSEPWFIKTHRCEENDDRVIYIVRDARAAMLSYQGYQRKVNGLSFPLQQFVLGARPLEDWSRHVEWARRRRRRTTLILRFEELSQASDEVLDRISAFVGLPVLGKRKSRLTDLRKAAPEFFGQGTNQAGIEAVESLCPSLFWLLHGRAMQAMGYDLHARPRSGKLIDDAFDELREFVGLQLALLRQLQGHAAPKTIDFA